jgi:hypothetical protein
MQFSLYWHLLWLLSLWVGIAFHCHIPSQMCNLPNNHNSNIQCDTFSHMHTNLIVESMFINGIWYNTQMRTNEKNETKSYIYNLDEIRVQILRISHAYAHWCKNISLNNGYIRTLNKLVGVPLIHGRAHHLSHVFYDCQCADFIKILALYAITMCHQTCHLI